MINNEDISPKLVERYYAILPKDDPGVDFIAITALIISLFTLVFTYYGFFLNKKLEIKHGVFNDIIIKHFDSLFCLFQQKIDLNSNATNADIIDAVNDLSNSIDVHVVNLDNVYYKFQMDKLIILKEDFCDYFFDNPNEVVIKCNDKFITFSTKLKIELYKELELQFSLSFIIKKYLKGQTYLDILKYLKKSR